MKTNVFFISIMLAARGFAVPSANNYSAVTNDWALGNFTNVYELAQKRLERNANDVVATYIMHDWCISFCNVRDMSNSVNRILTVSASVTNAEFVAVFNRLRPAYIEYRDSFLPTLTQQMVDADRSKSYLLGTTMGTSSVLRLLERLGLW